MVELDVLDKIRLDLNKESEDALKDIRMREERGVWLKMVEKIIPKKNKETASLKITGTIYQHMNSYCRKISVEPANLQLIIGRIIGTSDKRNDMLQELLNITFFSGVVFAKENPDKIEAYNPIKKDELKDFNYIG